MREGGERRQASRSRSSSRSTGARSEVTVELAGAQAELKDHRIPLEKGRDRGWGRVSIPADANPADNDFWFVFEQPAPRRAVVVVEDPAAARPLELAASISPDPLLKCAAEVVAAGQLAAVDWDQVSLLLWQAPLPDPQVSKQVQAFVDRGGSAIFFPAHVAGAGEIFGVRWTSWVDQKAEAPVESWRGDEDLLAHTASGQPLPVGQLQIRKYCGLSGEVTPLATLRGGAPLLARVTTSRGAAYFCATTPAPADSSLATSGVVFYVLVQRALAARSGGAGEHPPAHGRRDAPPTTRPRGSGWPAPRKRFRPISRFTAASTRTASGCWPSIAPRRSVGAGAGRPPRGRAVPGARLCPGRRQGRQHRLVDPGDLATVPGRHDGGDGGRGRPLPAQGGASRGSGFMSVSRSLTFLGTPWSVAVSLAGRAVHRRLVLRRLAAQRLSAVDGVARTACGWRWSATVAVLLNQPEWIEEFRPEEKPAIAVLWDASASMDTRDVVRPTSRRRQPITPRARPSPR